MALPSFPLLTLSLLLIPRSAHILELVEALVNPAHDDDTLEKHLHKLKGMLNVSPCNDRLRSTCVASCTAATVADAL